MRTGLPLIGDAAHRANGLLAQGADHLAAGHVRILPGNRLAHGGDGQVEGREALGIDPDVDRPF
jgi:hypothetical protein